MKNTECMETFLGLHWEGSQLWTPVKLGNLSLLIESWTVAITGPLTGNEYVISKENHSPQKGVYMIYKTAMVTSSVIKSNSQK